MGLITDLTMGLITDLTMDSIMDSIMEEIHGIILMVIMLTIHIVHHMAVITLIIHTIPVLEIHRF